MNRFDIPGYKEAISREGNRRNAAFLDPLTRIAPGIVIRQMTTEDFIILDGLDSVMLEGELPTPVSMARDLFILSRWHRFDNALADWLYRASGLRSVLRWIFARRCRRLDFIRRPKHLATYIEAQRRVREYIEFTFQDSPEGAGGERVPFASFAAHYVNCVAGAYGWGERAVLRLPLRRLYQYIRCIRSGSDQEYRPFNPSDVIRNAHNSLRNQRVRLIELLKRRKADMEKAAKN